MIVPLTRTRLVTQTDSDGLISSFLQLELRLRNRHFQDGRVKVKCTAMLGDFFLRSDEKSLEMVRTGRQIVMENKSRRGDVREEDHNQAGLELFSDEDDRRWQ